MQLRRRRQRPEGIDRRALVRGRGGADPHLLIGRKSAQDIARHVGARSNRRTYCQDPILGAWQHKLERCSRVAHRGGADPADPVDEQTLKQVDWTRRVRRHAPADSALVVAREVAQLGLGGRGVERDDLTHEL